MAVVLVHGLPCRDAGGDPERPWRACTGAACRDQGALRSLPCEERRKRLLETRGRGVGEPQSTSTGGHSAGSLAVTRNAVAVSVDGMYMWMKGRGGSCDSPRLPEPRYRSHCPQGPPTSLPVTNHAGVSKKYISLLSRRRFVTATGEYCSDSYISHSCPSEMAKRVKGDEMASVTVPGRPDKSPGSTVLVGLTGTFNFGFSIS